MDSAESHIIEGLKLGNSEAFEQLYTEYFGMIKYLVSRNGGGDADAEDVFQEAVYALYRKFKSENFTLKVKLKTYLYSVSRNIWLNELRRRGIRNARLKDYERYVEIGNMFSLGWKAKREKAITDMEKAMKFLGDKCKDILLKYYYEHKSMSDIAVELGYTNADNAKNQKYRCLRQLKFSLK